MIRKTHMVQTLTLVLGAGLIFLLIAFNILAWTEPSQTPPAGSIVPPVNTGSVAQTKTGELHIGAGANYWITQQGDSFALKNNASIIQFVVGQDGNVGIGATAPTQKLHVAGGIRVTNLVSCNTIDTNASGDFACGTDDAGAGGNWTLSGINLYPNSTTYNVGIGTTAPGYKLDVASGGATTARFGTASADKVVIGGGAGKLDAGTIDPIFEIDGKKYATYMADFAGGTRVETSGTLQLATNNLQPQVGIDFENLEEGSDLWLFWQASNKNLNDWVVILTPGFEGNVWYEKEGNSVIVHGDRAGEVSYRLSAPRVDYKEWSNLADDQSLTGIKVSGY